MGAGPTLLKVLLTRQHWQTYDTFCREYERTAIEIDRKLSGTAPSRAQYYRWLTGQLRGGVPYPDACRVLEGMFPGRTAAELFAECPPDANTPSVTALNTGQPGGQLADVTAVYASRADFAEALPTATLLHGARSVRAAGLSLNMFGQHPDGSLRRMIEGGTTMRCLFLDPQGDAIRAREREEGHASGALVALTELNIGMLIQRIGARLSPAARERLQVRVYDETIRFNIILIDERIGVLQPYMPESRGTDSPTLVLEPGGTVRACSRSSRRSSNRCGNGANPGDDHPVRPVPRGRSGQPLSGNRPDFPTRRYHVQGRPRYGLRCGLPH